MGNPEHARQATRTVTVELTGTDVELLAKVRQCYADRGAELSAPDALHIGLRELADRCRPHGINKKRSKMEMTLTKPQVVQYAKAYMTLGSSFPGRNAGEADECISDVLKSAEHNGLSLEDLHAVGQWKAGGRLRHLIDRNDEDKVLRVSRAAFAESNEQLRIEKLTELDGVSWPMASTILHFVFPECYPIIDIRAMSTLGGPDPSRFNRHFANWKEYYELCRNTAKEYGVSLRDLDRALWTYDYCYSGECLRCPDHDPGG